MIGKATIKIEYTSFECQGASSSVRHLIKASSAKSAASKLTNAKSPSVIGWIGYPTMLNARYGAMLNRKMPSL